MGKPFKSGHLAKVTVYGELVRGLNKWASDGLSWNTLENTEFSDLIQSFQFGTGRSGLIGLSGFYLADDTTGQDVLSAACINNTVFNSGDIRLYVDDDYYYTVEPGGEMRVIQTKAIKTDRNKLIEMMMAIRYSGGAMIRLSRLDIAWDAATQWDSATQWDAENFA